MGYACPVCGTPQADAEHLANHLAFTALLGREDHAAWLDEHAPEWREHGPEELAPVVAERAPETEFEAVFEDTSDQAHEHGHAHEPSFEGELARHGGYGRGGTATDPDAERVLAEARELTERMYGVEEGEDEGGDESDAGASEPDADGDEGGDERRGDDAVEGENE